MLRSNRAVKGWLAEKWRGWWRRNTTDPDPKVTGTFRMFFFISSAWTLLFSLCALINDTYYNRLMHTCIAAFWGGLAALCSAVLRERRRRIP